VSSKIAINVFYKSHIFYFFRWHPSPCRRLSARFNRTVRKLSICTGRNSSSFLALCESASLDEFLLQLATASHHSLILLQHAVRPAILEAGHTEILRGLGILVNCLVYLLLKLIVQVLDVAIMILAVLGLLVLQSFRDGTHQSAHHLLHGLLWYHADHLAGDCVVAILL